MITDKNNPHGGDVYGSKVRLDFSANVNPYGVSRKVKAAIKNSLGALRNYPDAECRELRRAIAEKENQTTEHIICGNGASELIYSFVYAAKIKKALVVCPTFAEYEKALDSAGAKTERYFLSREKGFALDGKILDGIKPQTDAVFLCNPNNPTGKTAEKGLVEAAAERCASVGARLFLDECFNDWLDNPNKSGLADKIEKYPNLIIVKAFTKNYGLAGVRLGYAVCSDEKFLREMSCFTPPWNVSGLAQTAGVAALADQGHFKKAKRTVKEEKPRLAGALTEFGFEVYGGDANFLFFRADKDLGQKLLARGILIRNCGNFEGLDENYFRICVKTRKENEILVEEIRRVL